MDSRNTSKKDLVVIVVEHDITSHDITSHKELDTTLWSKDVNGNIRVNLWSEDIDFKLYPIFSHNEYALEIGDFRIISEVARGKTA